MEKLTSLAPVKKKSKPREECKSEKKAQYKNVETKKSGKPPKSDLKTFTSDSRSGTDPSMSKQSSLQLNPENPKFFRPKSSSVKSNEMSDKK